MSLLQRAFKIIDILQERPMNLKQISSKIEEKYTTTRQTILHLQRIEKVECIGLGLYKIKVKSKKCL